MLPIPFATWKDRLVSYRTHFTFLMRGSELCICASCNILFHNIRIMIIFITIMFNTVYLVKYSS